MYLETLRSQRIVQYLSCRLTMSEALEMEPGLLMALCSL